jgi:hypothetical protein
MCKKNMKIPVILLLTLATDSLSGYISLNSQGNDGMLRLLRFQPSGGLLRGSDGPLPFATSSLDPYHAMLMNHAIQTLSGYKQFQPESPPDVVAESSAARICTPWRDRDRGDGPGALQFLNDMDRNMCQNADSSSDGECRFIGLVKTQVGGSFTPSKLTRTVISEAVSYTGLPDEKRVTATIILNPESASNTPLGSLFEEFIAQRGNDNAEKPSRVRNAIKVNHRQEELSISADGGLDDIYVFSHSNDKTHSIWIVLYIGKTKKVADGRKLIEAFENNLIARNIWIADSAVLTSEEEEKMEKEAEIEEKKSYLQNLESTARFALKIHCIAFRGIEN